MTEAVLKGFFNITAHTKTTSAQTGTSSDANNQVESR